VPTSRRPQVYTGVNWAVMMCGGCGRVGRRFRGEETGDEMLLETGGALVGDGSREVDVAEEGVPHWASHYCYRKGIACRCQSESSGREM
jgi:hypothetical protein